MPTSSRIQKACLSTGNSSAIQLASCFLLLFICVGSLPPGINESHYLPKAKYACDYDYAAGGDLFLQSSNTHWLTSSLVGRLAKYMDLSTVAWISRTAAWISLSIAWIKVCSAAGIAPVLRPMGLLAWFLWNSYGNWAGEWFVGGFEAKCVAYPCVLMSICHALHQSWNRTWVWLGTAVAWHPIVGGWAAVSLLGYWLTQGDWYRRSIDQLTGITLAALIGLVGIVPALQGLRGSDIVGNISASQIHCFYRLAHHLSPQTFSWDRNTACLISLSALISVTLTARWIHESGSTRRITTLLLSVAWVAVIVSAIGWLLDRSISYGIRQDIAARLLRFYFFRWSDVALPLAVVLILAKWLSGLNRANDSPPAGNRNRVYQFAVAALLVLMTPLGVWQWNRVNQIQVPPADQMLLDSVGPYAERWPEGGRIQTDLRPKSSATVNGWRIETEFPQRYADWLEVCQWIRDNTPPDSLWLTPRNQQTFKWYAGRAEVVNWKDVPQDNLSIIEWYQRIQACYFPGQRGGSVGGWTTEQLRYLANRYGFQWVLIDRTYQQEPPLFEMKYPELIDNRSFAVFHIPRDYLQ